MRVSLLTIATVAFILPLHSVDVSAIYIMHHLADDPVNNITGTMNNQPPETTISFLLIGGRLLFSPECCGLGTRLHQTDNCRPLVNCSAFSSLRNADTKSGPIPGIVISTLYLDCCWHRTARLFSVARICSLSACMFPSNECSNWRSTGGNFNKIRQTIL